MNMMLEQFKTIFDRPEKVKKLREVILNLAVRGKLVEQDPNDEPASVLLERIREEKERLIREKKIKREKPLGEISEEEKIYELPEGWELAHINEIAFVTKLAGFEYTKYLANGITDEGDVPVVRAKNIKMNNFIENTQEFISFDLSEKLSRSALYKKCIIITFIGAGIGEVAIFDKISRYHLAPNVAKIEIFNNFSVNVDEKYTLYYLMSSIGQKDILRFLKATAQPSLSMETIRKVRVTLPPLNEQKRIVKKVDSLMNFCEKLEKSLEKKVHYGSLISKSVFNSIGNATTTEELEETLRFILSNFKDLSLGDNAVKELKNCILQLAVQGKLVPQDLSDEPAEVLLEKMQVEKERLIKEKKIKKVKLLADISEDEKTWKLPKGWQWIRLGDYCIINPRNSVDDNDDASFIPMRLINDGFDNKHSYEIEKWKEIKSGFTHFAENDVVVAKITPCFENRKSAMMKKLINGVGAGTTELYVIRSISGMISQEFILAICKTERFISGGVETYTGTAGQQRVKKDYINNLVIGLPPLAEQKRIIEKVNSVMSLCDELEKKIEKSKKYSNRLMESILKDSFKA